MKNQGMKAYCALEEVFYNKQKHHTSVPTQISDSPTILFQSFILKKSVLDFRHRLQITFSIFLLFFAPLETIGKQGLS